MKTKETSKATAKKINEKLQPTKSVQISKIELASNLKSGVSQTIADADARQSTTKLKSGATHKLKTVHNSLNSTLRTIHENFNAVEVQRYIEDLKNSTSISGVERVSLHITVDDFNRDDILSMLPYYTDYTNKRVFCKFALVSDTTLPARSFGDYTALNNEVITPTDDDAQNGVLVIFNGVNGKGEAVQRTLKPITGFSFWHIISVVVKRAKIEAQNGQRARRIEARKVSDIAKTRKLSITKCKDMFFELYDTGTTKSAIKFFELLDADADTLAKVQRNKK